MSLCGIFNDFEAVLACKLFQSGQVNGPPVKVYGDNSFRFRSQRLFDGSDVNVKSCRIDIHKYRACSNVADSFRRGEEGIGGHNDLISRPDPRRLQAELQSRCA